MRVYECVCGQRLFYESTACLRCERRVAWCAGCATIAPIESSGEGAWRCLRSGCGAELVLCQNSAVQGVCNRTVVRAAAGATLCDCCRFNEVIPDLSVAGHRERWARLEEAKRRVFYELDALGLERGTAADGFEPALSFDFATGSLPKGPGHWRPMGNEQVLTGHASGKITINLKEADEAERTRLKVMLGEGYRTLVGHFRHELGHYYWDLLVRPDPARLETFTAVFGDANAPYGDALKQYYAAGPPADWAARFTSAYASSHPWEDWAETFAAYLEVISTLDTADAEGLGASTGGGIRERVRRYQKLGIALNELNRAMGLDDLLTRQFPEPVLTKLERVDEWIHAGRPVG